MWGGAPSPSNCVARAVPVAQPVQGAPAAPPQPAPPQPAPPQPAPAQPAPAQPSPPQLQPQPPQPQPPQQSTDRRGAPCEHNAWDNVRIKHGISTLRCRTCQSKWRLHFSQFTRCQEFRKGTCVDTCPYVHVHQFKETLESRHERFGNAVLDGVPKDVAEAVSRTGHRRGSGGSQGSPSSNNSAASRPSTHRKFSVGAGSLQAWAELADDDLPPPLTHSSTSSDEKAELPPRAQTPPAAAGSHVAGGGRSAAVALASPGSPGHSPGNIAMGARFAELHESPGRFGHPPVRSCSLAGSSSRGSASTGGSGGDGAPHTPGKSPSISRSSRSSTASGGAPARNASRRALLSKPTMSYRKGQNQLQTNTKGLTPAEAADLPDPLPASSALIQQSLAQTLSTSDPRGSVSRTSLTPSECGRQTSHDTHGLSSSQTQRSSAVSSTHGLVATASWVSRGGQSAPTPTAVAGAHMAQVVQQAPVVVGTYVQGVQVVQQAQPAVWVPVVATNTAVVQAAPAAPAATPVQQGQTVAACASSQQGTAVVSQQWLQQQQQQQPQPPRTQHFERPIYAQQPAPLLVQQALPATAVVSDQHTGLLPSPPAAARRVQTVTPPQPPSVARGPQGRPTPHVAQG